jgi:hypothetical protein
MSFTLKELKTSNKELRDEHDKLEKKHDELNTSLIVANELSLETHDATNQVVKIDITTSCDDLIIESIEQGSSGKDKKWLSSTIMMIMSSLRVKMRCLEIRTRS